MVYFPVSIWSPIVSGEAMASPSIWSKSTPFEHLPVVLLAIVGGCVEVGALCVINPTYCLSKL
jgi:hypothetical protein